MRNFILIGVLMGTLVGCSTMDEYFLRPTEIQADGTVVEAGPSKAEEKWDKIDDTAIIVVPAPWKWTVPTLSIIIGLLATITTRTKPFRKKREGQSEPPQEPPVA